MSESCVFENQDERTLRYKLENKRGTWFSNELAETNISKYYSLILVNLNTYITYTSKYLNIKIKF